MLIMRYVLAIILGVKVSGSNGIQALRQKVLSRCHTVPWKHLCFSIVGLWREMFCNLHRVPARIPWTTGKPETHVVWVPLGPKTDKGQRRKKQMCAKAAKTNERQRLTKLMLAYRPAHEGWSLAPPPPASWGRCFISLPLHSNVCSTCLTKKR